MQLYKKQCMAYIFLFTAVLSSLYCNNPSESQNNKKMTLEIISWEEFLITPGDSTVYQHNTQWDSYLKINAYDSLANLLKNSKVPIEDMWCPNEQMRCKIPYTPGMEVIIKLKNADTSIFKYGFQKYGGLSISCFNFWRHYKYTYN